MFIVLITRIRDGIMLLMRVLMFIAIIIVLLGQIYSAIINSGILPGNRFHKNPEGMPMRVEEKGLQAGNTGLEPFYFFTGVQLLTKI